MALALLSFIVFQCMSVIFAATSSNLFTYSSHLNDKKCVDDELIFALNDRSKVQCCVICRIMESCVGVFYEEIQHQCFGCRKTGPSYLTDIKGTVAFLPLQDCPKYLVKDVDDSQLSASSNYENWPDLRYSVIYARLDTIETYHGTGAWSPWFSRDREPFIQVDFLEVKRVEGVVTQGRSGMNQWVTEYQVAISSDCINWNYIVDTEGNIVHFPGNNDRNTYVTNLFDYQKIARCVRVKPRAYINHPSMRFDILGCDM